MRLPHIVLLAAAAVAIFLLWKHREKLTGALSK